MSDSMANCSTEGCKGRPRGTDTLCKKCKNKKNAAENDYINEDIIINEVVWYIDQHRHAATKDNIIRAVSCFYDTDEIDAAKKELVTRFGDHIDAELKKSRRDSQQRSERMKLCEDIFAILERLDEDIDLVCVARNWKKMLKCNPEEMTDLSVAEKVAQFSAKFRAYDDALSEMRAQIITLQERTVCDKPPLMTDVVKRKKDDTAAAKSGGSVPRVNRATSEKPASVSSPPRLNSSDSDVIEVPEPVETRPNNSTSTKLPHDGFQVQREERRRQQRDANKQKRRPVAGQSDAGGLRRSPMPTWHFFVYKVHKDDNVDEVREFVQKQDVIVSDLAKTSHNESKYNSFKLSISKEFAEKVLNADFWPKGIYIRRWHDRRQQNAEMGPKNVPTSGNSQTN